MKIKTPEEMLIKIAKHQKTSLVSWAIALQAMQAYHDQFQKSKTLKSKEPEINLWLTCIFRYSCGLKNKDSKCRKNCYGYSYITW